MIYARYEEGYSQSEIGKFYGLSQSAVSLIVLAMKRGIDQEVAETRGSKPKLDKTQLAALSDLLQSGSRQSGFTGWNKWSIQELIKEKFGVDYHENYIYVLMRKIGYSSQLPAKKDYRQDAKRVADFKTVKLAAVKKN